MAEQERVPYNRPKERSQQYEYEAKDTVRDQEDGRRKQQAARKAGELAVEASDDLLDEIDNILEENATEFLQQYVQAGGE